MMFCRFFLKALQLLLAVALSVFLAACSSSEGFYRDVELQIAQKNYASALQQVRENRSTYGDKSEVLYHLDLGLLYHYAGELDSSTQHFFAAEKLIDDLYTKSISQQALSFLLNDNILPYDGEDFERVLINVFLALNYAEKGMIDDALVEARKADLKLREYSRQYEDKNTYKEDAFIRYIAGVLYEMGGEVNDAYISYRKSYETYQTYAQTYGTPAPGFLLDDIVRTATKLQFTQEAEQYASLGGEIYSDPLNSKGSLLVIVYSGKAPIKIEERPMVSVADTGGTLHTFQVALPKFTPRTLIRRSYEVAVNSLSDSLTDTPQIAEDVTAIAKKCLEDRLTLLYLKSGGRALVKFLASEKLKSGISKDKDDKAKNFLSSLAVDLFVGATEQADTRSWRTLPAEIHLSRLSLNPGSYSLHVRDMDGNMLFTNDSVHVSTGNVSFIIVDDVR